MLPRYLGEQIVLGTDVHRYPTRRSNVPRTPSYLSLRAQNSLYYKGMYNLMPREVVNATSLGNFKKACALYVKQVI